MVVVAFYCGDRMLCVFLFFCLAFLCFCAFVLFLCCFCGIGGDIIVVVVTFYCGGRGILLWWSWHFIVVIVACILLWWSWHCIVMIVAFYCGDRDI